MRIITLVLLLSSIASAEWVQGYYKANGTYVQGYYRTDRNSIEEDNYSYKPTQPNTYQYNNDGLIKTPKNGTYYDSNYNKLTVCSGGICI